MPDDTDELQHLRAQNRKLREELNMRELDPHEDLTEEWLEKENSMLRNQISILNENRALIDSPNARDELLFLLQFLKAIPLPLWTSDIKAKITYWNLIAARTYGYSARKAMGKNFMELFVSVEEREQAEVDLANIIGGQEGEEHFNLCKDKDHANRSVYLATCCFPVFDPRTGSIAEAEVSIDLRNLGDMEAELDEMYKKYQQKEEIRVATEKTVRTKLVDQIFVELKSATELRKTAVERKINKNREIIAEPGTKGAQLQSQQRALNENLKLLQDIETAYAEFVRETFEAPEMSNDQLYDLLARVRKFGSLSDV